MRIALIFGKYLIQITLGQDGQQGVAPFKVEFDPIGFGRE